MSSKTLYRPHFTDPDRKVIWDMLVVRDSIAFAAADWFAVIHDFAADQFEGISANGSIDPGGWTITYPKLDDYRDAWIRMAKEFLQLALVGISHQDLVLKLSSMDQIEISGDRALCHKKFSADEPLASGGRYRVSSQTIYRLHRIEGEWKIVGFLAQLPLGEEAKRNEL